MPFATSPGAYYQTPVTPPAIEPPVRPNSPAHADFLARNTSTADSDTTDYRTPIERLAAEPTTTDLLAQRDTANHTYTISTRSFAPPESFGGGFEGDNRGYTTDWDATSRIHSTVTIDADDQIAIGPGDVDAHSDPSVHHAIPFYRPTETPDVTLLSQSVDHDGDVSTINFETRHSGEDAVPRIPIIDMNPSPTLDVNTNLQIVSDREANTLTITGEITGDDFPATEVFINDNNGQAVFVATGKPPGVATPIANLLDFGVWDRQIADVSTTINTDEQGNFLSVESGGRNYTIDEWNREFESRDPGFVDPLEGVNDAASELHEGYGEIGAEFSEASREISEADNVFTGAYEVGEAGVEIVAEIGETAISTGGGLVTGTAEAGVGIADWVVPGDGIPFVDLNLPEAPGWWPGK
jgi:hypothetical protein